MQIQQKIDKIIITLQKRQQEAVIATIIFLVTLIAYYTYQSNQEQHIKNASLIYYTNIVAREQNDHEKLKALSTLTSNYKKTIYAQLAHAKLAKLAAEKKDFAKAIDEYHTALLNTEDSSIRNLFQIRLAKLYILTKKPEKALIAVNKIHDNRYTLIKNIITTDAHILNKNYNKANSVIKDTIQQCKKTKSNEHYLVLELIKERQKQIANHEK